MHSHEMKKASKQKKPNNNSSRISNTTQVPIVKANVIALCYSLTHTNNIVNGPITVKTEL